MRARALAVMLAAVASTACVIKQDPAAPPPPAPITPSPTVAPPMAVAPPDAGSKACGGFEPGACPAGEFCRSCSQPDSNTYFCTTECVTNKDCKDPKRPSCEGAPSGGKTSKGFCAQQGMLHHCQSKCAAPGTPILTPTGERPIESLRAGDLVYSVDGGRVVVVPLVETTRVPVIDHQVVRVTLAGGATLLVSPGHPTADGRTFGDLWPGDRLGEATVAAVETTAYPYDATYDVLPDSDSGAYFAGGALIGSTLKSAGVGKMRGYPEISSSFGGLEAGE
jgi:hypothetical protein